MRTENLVVIHSFPTNSVLFQEAICYLNRYFTVHFIDLPGFNKDVLPLPRVCLAAYAQFVECRIKELNLESYLIAGVSFGFAVINNMTHDDRCLGIVAITPYTGPDSLRMGMRARLTYRMALRLICNLRLPNVLWNTGIARAYLMRQFPPRAAEVVLEHIHAPTFFETARLILGGKNESSFHRNYPHILLANEADGTIRYDHIATLLKAHVDRLLVLNITFDHFVKTPSQEYFEQHLPERVVRDALEFIALQRGG